MSSRGSRSIMKASVRFVETRDAMARTEGLAAVTVH